VGAVKGFGRKQDNHQRMRETVQVDDTRGESRSWELATHVKRGTPKNQKPVVKVIPQAHKLPRQHEVTEHDWERRT